MNITTRTFEFSLKQMDPFREPFRPASSKVVTDVLEKYTGSDDRILEIGSGYGELIRLAPEYRERIQQTDQNPMIVDENRRTTNSNIILADVYELPFSTGSYPIIVGYSVFDTLNNVDDALKEMHRVLKHNGKVVHFLDIGACQNIYFEKCLVEGSVPFSLYEYDDQIQKMYESGLQIFDEENTEKIKKYFEHTEPSLSEFIDFHINNPENMYITSKRNPDFGSIAIKISKILMSSGIKSTKIRYNKDFNQRLARGLEKNGYSILESGKKNGIAVVQRDSNPIYSTHGKENIFYNDQGIDKSRFDLDVFDELGPEKVKVVSRLDVVVARRV